MGSVRFSSMIPNPGVNMIFTTTHPSCPIAHFKLVMSGGKDFTNVNIATRSFEYPPTAGIMFNRNTTGTYNFFIRGTTEGGKYKDLPI
jgi:hypothetical protein